jgi:hypothetical protein
MDRRKNLKLLFTGSLGTSLLFHSSCKDELSSTSSTLDSSPKPGLYGRIPEEIKRDLELLKNEGFSKPEMKVIAILAEIICPKEEDCVGAIASGVPEFIDFIAKDIPSHKLPLQGGIMWIENEAMTRYNHKFEECSPEERLNIVEDIAWPDKAKPEHSQGVKFFNLMRDLTMTGYFTSKEGIKDLGYLGNVPNVWDGVPEDELKKHSFSYDNKWKDLYIKENQRNVIATWDENGNLI